MPSAFPDRSLWRADFRGLFGRRRRLTIPGPHCRTPEDARAFAFECERYCRILERAPAPGLADVRHALHLGAITQDEAASILHDTDGVYRIHLSDGDRLTLKAAFDMHPATQREARATGAEYRKHARALSEFLGAYRLTFADELRLAHVQDWLARLHARRLAFDTRRHKLIPMRRAARMAAGLGLPDPLVGLRLDRNDARPAIDVWTLPELLAMVEAAQASGDRFLLGVLVLGGLVGLRPTEIVRARAEDLRALTLSVGQREVKNPASRRALPLPPTIAAWLALDTPPPPPHGALIYPPPRMTTPLGENDLSRKFARRLTRLNSSPIYPVKVLRKSFATWVIEAGADMTMTERWLGHTLSGLMPVTQRHYLAAHQTRQLQPLATLIETHLTTHLVTKIIER
jgi:site-specific recombinase XerD